MIPISNVMMMLQTTAPPSALAQRHRDSEQSQNQGSRASEW